MIVTPNILHLRSHLQPSSSSAFPLSLTCSSCSRLRFIRVLMPYSFRQHWNRLPFGASCWVERALPSICLSALLSRVFRSSRSPQRRNNFSRRIANVLDDFRRLHMPWSQWLHAGLAKMILHLLFSVKFE